LDINSVYLNELINTGIHNLISRFLRLAQSHTMYIFNKNLYEFKQASKIWNNLTHISILELGFIHYSINKCVYICYSSKDKCIFRLYVDDFNIAKYLVVIKHFKTKFATKFDIKDLELIKLLLSIQVSQWKEEVAIF
jgi:Reverse transcriptase (RNA-dependent DNA polymerase)